MRKILYILVIGVLVLGVWRYFDKRGNTISLNLAGIEALSDEVIVEYPKFGDKVQSGVVVSGRARGSWYFEASAPVKVLGKSGETLGQGYVTATGEWMTTEFVPFKGTINFDKGMNKSGYLVFMNDNPSGEESRSKYVVVEVSF